MKKRKTIWKAALLVTGIAFVMDRIRVHKKMKELNKRITKVGHCHNDFCLMQGRINQSTEEQYMNTWRSCQRKKKMGGKSWRMYQSRKT